MDIEIKNALTREEAKSRIIGLIGKLKEKYGGQIEDLKEEWSGDKGKFEGSAKGHSVSGSIDVKDLVVDIHIKIPFMLRIFSGKIRSVIEEQVGKELH